MCCHGSTRTNERGVEEIELDEETTKRVLQRCKEEGGHHE